MACIINLHHYKQLTKMINDIKKVEKQWGFSSEIDGQEVSLSFKCLVVEPYKRHGHEEKCITILIGYLKQHTQYAYYIDPYTCHQFCKQYEIGDHNLKFFLTQILEDEGSKWMRYFDFQRSPRQRLIVINNTLYPYAQSKKHSPQRIKTILEIILKIKTHNLEKDSFKSLRQELIDLINKSICPEAFKSDLLSLFDFRNEYKHQYDQDIFRQARFQYASFEKILVYNPTHITRRLLINILDKQKSIQFLYGQAGVGKSISVSLIVTLFQIVTDYKLQQKNFCKLLELLDHEETQLFNKIPALFYFTFNNQGRNVDKFYSSIRKQLPVYFAANMDPSQTLIPTIKRYFEDRNIKFQLIIDQINSYYAKIRQKQETLQIQMITQLLRSIRDNNIIFISSENIQIYMKQQQNTPAFVNILKIKPNVHVQKITDQEINFTHQGRLEKFFILLFEFQRHTLREKLSDKERMEKINRIQIYFKKLFQNKDFFQFFQHQFRLCETTHQKIANCCQDQTIQSNFEGQLKIFQIQGKSLLSESFQPLSDTIFQYIINLERTRYQEYVVKDPAPQIKCSRYLTILSMRTSARQERAKTNDKGQKIYKFMHYLTSNKDIYQINKEHTQIDQKQKNLTIFYSPSTFLLITDFIGSFVSQIRGWRQKKLIQKFSDKKFFTGQLMDSTLKHLLSRANITLYLRDNAYKIKYMADPMSDCCYFTSYYDIQKEKDSGMRHRFSQAFRYLKDNKFNKTDYICALPRRLTSKSKYDDQNSQTIDCVFLSNPSKDQKYSMISIDFTVSDNWPAIKKKMDKARLFFKKFNRLIKQQKKLDGQRPSIKVQLIDYEKQGSILQQKRQLPKRGSSAFQFQWFHYILAPTYLKYQYRQQEQNEDNIDIIFLEDFNFKPMPNEKFQNQEQWSDYYVIWEIIRVQLKQIASLRHR